MGWQPRCSDNADMRDRDGRSPGFVSTLLPTCLSLEDGMTWSSHVSAGWRHHHTASRSTPKDRQLSVVQSDMLAGSSITPRQDASFDPDSKSSRSIGPVTRTGCGVRESREIVRSHPRMRHGTADSPAVPRTVRRSFPRMNPHIQTHGGARGLESRCLRRRYALAPTLP